MPSESERLKESERTYTPARSYWRELQSQQHGCRWAPGRSANRIANHSANRSDGSIRSSWNPTSWIPHLASGRYAHTDSDTRTGYCSTRNSTPRTPPRRALRLGVYARRDNYTGTRQMQTDELAAVVLQHRGKERPNSHRNARRTVMSAHRSQMTVAKARQSHVLVPGALPTLSAPTPCLGCLGAWGV